MFKKLSEAMHGHRTKGTAVAGVVIALAGCLWGPFNIGTFQVPQFSSNEVIQIGWIAALAVFLHDKKGA